MCLAVPGKIVEKKGDSVVVDYNGDRRDAGILDGEYAVGDWVIVQGRIVIEKVPEEQVKRWHDFLNEKE